MSFSPGRWAVGYPYLYVLYRVLNENPLGGDMEDYARIDALGVLPRCLGPFFVIMIDDCERAAESRTLSQMRNALSEAGVDSQSRRYWGDKV